MTQKIKIISLLLCACMIFNPSYAVAFADMVEEGQEQVTEDAADSSEETEMTEGEEEKEEENSPEQPEVSNPENQEQTEDKKEPESTEQPENTQPPETEKQPEDTEHQEEEKEEPSEDTQLPDKEQKPETSEPVTQPLIPLEDPITEVDSPAMAVSNLDTVYVERSTGGGNDSNSGATADAPVENLDRALELVREGGTIIIGESGCFIQADNGNTPYPINKSVTIQGAPSAKPLTTRRSGFVLGADVTFKDLSISLVSRDTNAIFANGHTLTLDNVAKDNWDIHIFGGTASNANATQGSKSTIIIEGSSKPAGNIYAGSMDGSSDIPVDIRIETGGKGEVYASGAQKGYYDANDLFGGKAPEAPAADKDKYPVNDNVTISLVDSGITKVDGATHGSDKAEVSISENGRRNNTINLLNISKLTVEANTKLQPQQLNEGVDIEIGNKGELDFTTLTQNNNKAFSIQNLTGGNGILILGRTDTLTVNGNVTGTTEFQTDDNRPMNGSTSGAVNKRVYIVVKGTSAADAFTFKPLSTQSKMKFVNQNGSWTITDADTGSNEIVVNVELSENSYTYDGKEKRPTVTVKYQDAVIPSTEYTVTYKDNVNVGAASVVVEDNPGGQYNIQKIETPFSIDPCTIEVSALTSGEKYYDGTKSVTITEVTFIDADTKTPVLLAKSDYRVTNAQYKSADAGTKEVTATVVLEDSAQQNCDFENGPTATVTMNVSPIKKGRAETFTDTLAVKNHQEKEYTHSLNMTPSKGEWGNPQFTVNTAATTIDSKYSDKSQIAVKNNNMLHIPIKNVNSDEEKSIGTVQVTITSDNYENSTFTLTVTTEKNPDASSEIVVDNPVIELSPDTFVYDGQEKRPSVTVKHNGTTIPSGEYSVKYTDNINAGTARVEITDNPKGKYKIKDSSAEFTIEKFPIQVSSITVAEKQYDSTKNAVITQVSFVEKGTQTEVALSASDYEVTSAQYNSANAGSDDVTAVIALKDTAKAKNYTLGSNSTVTMKGSPIKKGTAQAIPGGTLSVQNNHEQEYTYPLNFTPSKGEWGNPQFTVKNSTLDAQYSEQADIFVRNNVLHLPIKSVNTEQEGVIGTVEIAVASTNYEDSTFTLTVNATNKPVPNKTVLNLTLSNALYKIYNGNAILFDTNMITAKTDGGDIVSSVQYEYYWKTEDGTRLPSAPVHAGEYKLVVEVSPQEAAYIGSEEFKAVIGKKTVTAAPKPVEVKQNAPVPAPEMVYDGLVNSDKLEPSTIIKLELFKRDGSKIEVSDAVKTPGVYTIRWTNINEVSFNHEDYIVHKIETADFTVTKASDNSGNHGNGGNGGNGGGSGGSSGSDKHHGNRHPSSRPSLSKPSVSKPTASKPSGTVSGQVNVSAAVNKDGKANIAVSKENVVSAINAAKAEAKQQGASISDATVVIQANTTAKNAKTVDIHLSKEALQQLTNQKVAGIAVKADNLGISVKINQEAIKTISQQAKADVQLSVNRVDTAKLSQEAKNAIGNRPVIDLKMMSSKGNSITNFGNGMVSVEIPYAKPANENAGNLCAVYIDDTGKPRYLLNSSYDENRQSVIFKTNHFSVYGVGYAANTVSFADIANHWAKEDIQYAVSRGLVKGASQTAFSPETPITREMFVTALGKLASIDKTLYTKSSFTDVSSGAASMPYIEWANKNNILKGIGNGKFAPNAAITREQMAVAMKNYAAVTGYALPKVYEEITFTDSTKISASAKEAVKAMQTAGILYAKSGNQFAPQNVVTKAEASAVFRRFVELTINPETAQGWVKNDSGKLMYYKNGKPLTGTQVINGVSYTFNQYGERA